MSEGNQKSRRLEACRKLIAARSFVAGHLEAVARHSAAWDAMLHVYLASLEDREFLQSWFAPEVPAKAHRISVRLKTLHMVETSLDPRDHRRILVRLTDKGRTAMDAVMDHVTSAGFSSSDRDDA